MVTAALPVPLLDSTRVPGSQAKPFARPAKSHADAILAQAQNGEPDAFSQLYWMHKKRVYSICVSMVHDFALAEDLTQETFLQLHRKLTTFRWESVFTTWLHRMTVNIVLMRLRKRALPVVSLDDMMTSIPEEHIGRGFGACDLTQIGVVDRIAIERALAGISPGYRDTFVLHDVHGFQHREIASMQDCSIGNSKSQLHKARRALRGALSSQPTRRHSN
jgi:RNA polymerase sigma-70 factor (ECF subfamily)